MPNILQPAAALSGWALPEPHPRPHLLCPTQPPSLLRAMGAGRVGGRVEWWEEGGGGRGDWGTQNKGKPQNAELYMRRKQGQRWQQRKLGGVKLLLCTCQQKKNTACKRRSGQQGFPVGAHRSRLWNPKLRT